MSKASLATSRSDPWPELSQDRPALRACFHFCVSQQSQVAIVSKELRIPGEMFISIDFIRQSEKGLARGTHVECQASANQL
jgi:hypothetical protein